MQLKNSLDKIVIIHFGPVELYPPLQNFVRFLEKCAPKQQVTILTTTGMYKQLQQFGSHHPAVSIKRMGRSGPGIGSVSRLISYFSFYLGGIWYLLLKRPGTVLYYETLSSFPVYIYKRFISLRAKIMIHYHEYNSPGEYQEGMWLGRYFHKLEHWLYLRAAWVSHTNAYRMDLFLDDIKPIKILNANVVPNFPPRSWHKENIATPDLPLKFVYVGALSMDTMYTKQMAEWVEGQNGKATWHIYSYNITTEARDYLTKLNSSRVRLFEGMDYSVLPSVLCNYHVGVVLYNGHIPNYIYNAPNKLFEYLNAGLQVWIPKEMIGAGEYIDGIYVRSTDYHKLDNFNARDIRDSIQAQPSKKAFYAEDVFSTLMLQLLGKQSINEISF